MKRKYLATFLVAFFLTTPAIAKAESTNSLQKFMFYRSFIQDDSACSVSSIKGVPVFKGGTASSAAASCPDAFAWVQLIKPVSEEWWNWGIDQTVWPAKPLPLCSSSVKKNCCNQS